MPVDVAFSLLNPLAVVPVFVNAGAAVLPALIAGLGSALALLLKPREVARLIRSKPWTVLMPLVLALVIWGLWHWTTAAPARAARVGETSDETDWVKVALEIIQQENRAKLLGRVGSSAAPQSTSSIARYFRGGVDRSGYLGGPSPRGLVQLWNFTEESALYCISPIVSGNSVYGASCVLDAGGSYGSIFCLDADTGKPRWTTTHKDAAGTQEFKGFFSSPALSADGRSLVIGQGLHEDKDSELVCLDTATGRVRWLVPTPLHIEGSPSIAGDIVVAGAGAIEKGPDHKPQGHPEKEGNPGFVMGVRISDGKLLWRCPVNDPESSPAIFDGIAYIGSGLNGNAVVAIRIAPGDELSSQQLERIVWKTPTDYPATGAVSVTDDLVLVGCGKGDFVVSAVDPEGLVIALDRLTGSQRWRVKLPDAVLGAIAVRDGKAIVPVRNGEIVALDVTHNGAILWRTRLNDASAILAAPALTDSTVYAVSCDGYLAVLDASDGRIVEKIYLNAPNKPGELGLSTSAPLIANNRVYVGSETGGLQALISGNKRP